MAVDYSEVLKDLDERKAKLLRELQQVDAARPLMLEFKKMQDKAAADFQSPRRFVGIGATRAIPEFLEGKELLTTQEVLEGLRSEGWTTKSSDPLNVVGATLAQLKDTVERIGDRWRLKTAVMTDDQAKRFGEIEFAGLHDN